MKIERAIEILDPEHREHYESIEPVKDACRMGMFALEKQIKEKPVEFVDHGWCVDWDCPSCGHFHRAEQKTKYCSECGQAIDWSDNP